LSYKSHRYSYKVHFNVANYEANMLEDDSGFRLTNLEYLKSREKMIRFVLDKGRLLKMSLKTLHLAVLLMDQYFEKTSHSPSYHDDTLIAACALLVAAKSGELDERIPFISKLTKYTGLTHDPMDFKLMEVKIAEVLHWDLQRITYYSLVEYYLTAGILIPQDKLPKRLVDFLKDNGVEDTVRLLAKEEQTRPVHSCESLHAKPSSSSTHAKDSPPAAQEYVYMSLLPLSVRNDIIKVFELYSRDLSNLILRGT
jgi:hypothetical protein